MSTTIIIAEPSESIRYGIRTLLESESEFTIHGEVRSAEEIQALVSQLKPTVLLLEWRMRNCPAEKFLSKISKCSPMTKILIVSTWTEMDFEVPFNHSDVVCGYVWKHESEHLVDAVRRVAKGRKFISPLLGRSFRKRGKITHR